MKKIPYFVTLDAEGDNGWIHPHEITTANAKGVERFQSFCEQHEVKPIYLTTVEMANDEIFVNTTRQKNLEGKCEIGMHMHGWTTPPLQQLTEDDLQYLPFITEWPTDIIREKVTNITTLLKEKFGTEIISHRSGRWIVDERYLAILAENGYKIDCSVTPLINWSCSMGDPKQCGGADYSSCNPKPHIIGTGDNKILEIPMTTMRNRLYDNCIINLCLSLFPKSSRFYNGINSRKVVMLRPIIRNKSFLMNMIEKLARDKNIEHIEFIVHTSEVYKGTSPHCNTDAELDALYELMGQIFDKLNTFTESITFREYAKEKNL